MERQTKDTFVAFGAKGEELFRVAFTDIVSVGSSKRSFIFITLDEHSIPTTSMNQPKDGHGKFFVQAFRFATIAEASDVSLNLIRAVERSRVKDMQVT